MRRSILLVLASTLVFPLVASGQGLILPASGAYHRSMGGASTARGFDAAGALYWNPAAISGLPGSEVVIGSELMVPDIHLGSTLVGGASGYTRSDSGVVPITGTALVYQPIDSPLTYGLGVSTVAGGGVNFPGDVNNPLLAPTGPLNQFILGPQASSILIIGITPTVSAQVSDRLAFGAGPTVDVCLASFDPAFFGPTSQANILAPSQFPTGAHSRPFWGGGFRAGFTYQISDALVAGFSYTSPQWFETWRFNARDANGNPIQFRTQFSLPAVYSAGLAYDGIDRLTLAADVRYFDYSTTQLLGEPVRAGGAGWRSIWVGALGARYALSDCLSVQLGYIYGQVPIQEDLALFNTQIPALTEHTVSAGFYYQLNESIGMSLAYSHGFKNSVTGTVFQVIGNSTTIDAEFDSIALGIHVRFGPCCARQIATPMEHVPGASSRWPAGAEASYASTPLASTDGPRR